MSRRLATTPRSRVKNALRQVWLRSRERQAALKAAGRACERCGVKASVAKGREQKLEVHHRDGIDWDGIVDLVMRRMLPHPDRLEVLCPGCHGEEHGKGPCGALGGPTVASDAPEHRMGRGRETVTAQATFGGRMVTCCGRRSE